MDNINDRKPRILIVEDDSDLMSLICAVLPADAHVVAEPDGIAGVAAFRQALLNDAPFDTVCLDLMMPGMDGGRALRAMRRLEAEHGIGAEHARVVVMSAAQERSTVQKAVAAGADDYLVKPFTPDELLQRLRLNRLAKSA